MIEMPQRSVTRFFIPLIDVLTLLFCVFLITPLAQPSSEEGKSQPEGGQLTHEELVRDRQENLRTIRQLEVQLEQLRQAAQKPLSQRLAMRVLEIDGETGKLYYRDRANQQRKRIEISNQAEALALIEHDRMRLGASHRELLYVFLYPRDGNSGKPSFTQQSQYDSWFKGVQTSFDLSGDAP